MLIETRSIFIARRVSQLQVCASKTSAASHINSPSLSRFSRHPEGKHRTPGTSRMGNAEGAEDSEFRSQAFLCVLRALGVSNFPGTRDKHLMGHVLQDPAFSR